MATIGQFQQVLKDKARKLALELAIGKGLLNRIEEGGGSFAYNKQDDNLSFFNVPEELKEELERQQTKSSGYLLANI